VGVALIRTDGQTHGAANCSLSQLVVKSFNNKMPKVKVPRGGTFTLGFTHYFTITSSTSTIWFPRSLTYMASHLVFKVNHMVQGQPWTQPNPFYISFLFHPFVFARPNNVRWQHKSWSSTLCNFLNPPSSDNTVPSATNSLTPSF